jgi:hypothetical protein
MEPTTQNILDQTEQFMRAGGQLEVNEIGFSYSPDDPVRELRQDLLVGPNGEVGEYILGEATNDPVEVADGLLDIIVVAWGSLLAYFGPEVARELANEVGLSNLSKIMPDGTVKKNELGKILKPEGYFKPDVRGILKKAGVL